MAEDFRMQLKESGRSDAWGRWFDEIMIGDLAFSVQAGDVQDSTPQEVLDDINEYEAFQVTLRQIGHSLGQPKYGAWSYFEDKDWAKLFSFNGPAFGSAANVPTAVVQQIYEDLLEYAEKRKET